MTFSFLLIKRFLPIFTSFLIFVLSISTLFLFEYFSFFFFISFIFLIFISCLFFFILLGKEIKNFWPFVVNFILLISGTIFFLIFIRNQSLKIIFIFFLSIFFLFLLEIIFRFIYEPRKYPVYSLENISFLFLLINSFLFFSFFFALRTFFNFSIIYSLIFLFFIICWNLYFLFRLIKIPLERIYFLFVSLIILELFYSFIFLPTAFYVNGLILTILLFLIVNLIIKNKENLLTAEIIKKYLFFTSLALILTLLLAKWR